MSLLLLSRAGVIAASSVHTSTLPEAEWLMTCVAEDGAILETPGDINVRPYMSHYGALGLVRAYEVTSNHRYRDAVWSWCDWYAAHMNQTTGYVNDFTTDGSGNRVDSGAADSTDAYAGMYLVVAGLIYQATGDLERLRTLTPSLSLALTAIESTQQADGLTWALPTYPVKYLEDNLESLAGLQMAINLAAGLGESAMLARTQVDFNAMARGMGNLWNFETGTWDYALHEDNTFTPNDWSDENSQRQQAWANAWGAHESDAAAQALMSAYVAAVPDWASRRNAYEVLPAWALNELGDAAAASVGVAALEASITATGHAYPWTCATSGMFIAAKYGLPTTLPLVGVSFPDGINLMPNPDFAADGNGDGIADGVSNYGNPTMTLIATDPSPTHIQRMASPGGFDMHWDPIDVTPNRFYVLSCYRKITTLDPGNLGVLTFKRYTADGTYIDYGYAPTVPDVLDSDFVRWWVTIWADETVGKIQPIISAGNPGAITIDVKNVKLEQAGASPTPFVAPRHVSVVDHYAELNDVLSDPSGTLVWDNTGFDQAPEVGTIVNYDGWVFFVPSADCTVTFDTFGSGPQSGGGPSDTHLRVYQNLDTQYGDVAGLLLVGESDDDNHAHGGGATDGANSWVQVACQANNVYYVQVGSHGSHLPSAHMQLNWSGLDMVTQGAWHQRNDNLVSPNVFTPSQAQTISGAGQDVPFSNWDYSQEPFETGSHMVRSSWYTFVPTTNGTATVDTGLVGLTGRRLAAGDSTSGTDTYLRLYTGPDNSIGTDLVEVAADDDSGGPGGQSRLSYSVTAGQRYYVQASMYRDGLWNDRFALRWSIP